MKARRAVVTATLAVAMAALCAVAGCGTDPVRPPSSAPVSGSGPASGPAATTRPPAPPAPPAVPADVPTTGPNLLSPDEKPPVMPIEATRHTAEGALAFAKFFELTIDWAYATTSTTYMKHYYDAGCVTCESIREGVDDAAARVHHFLGGRMTITSATGLPKSESANRHAEAGARVVFGLTSSEVVDAGNEFVDADIARTLTDDVWLSWRDGRWLVIEIVPVP